MAMAASHIIVHDGNLIGNIHTVRNPFLYDGRCVYVLSIGEVYYHYFTLDRAIAMAMRKLPRGASLVAA